MTNPVPGRTITTAYGIRGSHWSCNRNSAGQGVHTGADFAAPAGTRVVAARGGTARHVNYGSAFGTRQLLIVAADGTADFYAHMRRRIPANGARVEAGAQVGEVGSEGNTTGPHLHFERHRNANGWNCSNHTNPQPSIDYGAPMEPGNVYASKLTRGQDDSDSVRRMQDVLNGIKLTGGQTLPVSGNYLEQTAAEVAKWQQQKATDKTITDGSRVTVTQARQLFTGTGHTVIDDVTTPEPEPEPPTDPRTISGFGLWHWYSGKPTKDLTVHPDGEWHRLGFKQPASGIKADSTELHFLYLRVELPKGRTADRVLETKFVRSDGDATAYDSEEYGTKKDSHPYYNNHFEAGSGLGGEWWVKVTGGSDPIKLTTRYAKTHVLYLDEPTISRMIAAP